MSRQAPLYKPVVSIDLKRKCIRIHRLTLHMMGNPEYIQLLVNPQTRMIALLPSIKQDYLAHHIRPSLLKTKNCYEIYSTDLMKSLQDIVCGWDYSKAFRIYGVMDSEKGIAQFQMNDTVQIKVSEQERTFDS